MFKVSHGMSSTNIYNVWAGMKARCNNPKHISYRHYGGKGITYDSNWETFGGFYKDMGNSYREGLSLERIDGSKNYCKKNCKWIPKSEQVLNTTKTVRITISGKTRTLQEWAKIVKIKPKTINNRIRVYGWSAYRAINTPLTRPVPPKYKRCKFCDIVFLKTTKKQKYCSLSCSGKHRSQRRNLPRSKLGLFKKSEMSEKYGY